MASMSMRQMLEAGVHFGHQTRFWNPKMAPFIFGERNRIHIINLEQTLPLYKEAAGFMQGVVADGGKVLFVGTKRSAREAIAGRSRALRHALRQPALARRHAHEFQDHPPVDQAPAEIDEMLASGALEQAQQARGADAAPRAGKARAQPRRHQGDGCACRTRCSSSTSVTRRSRSTRRRSSASRSSRSSTPTARRTASDYVDPGQRRRHARDPALRRRHRRCRARRQVACRKCRSARTSSSSSTRKASREPKTAGRPRRGRGRPPPSQDSPGARKPALPEHEMPVEPADEASRHEVDRGRSGRERRGVHGAPRGRPQAKRGDWRYAAAARQPRWRAAGDAVETPAAPAARRRGGVTMAVTAEAVKALRERTGAGMMECKKALVETNGDLDAAAEIMRKSGLAKADKKAGRIAAEGVDRDRALGRRPVGRCRRSELRDGFRRAREAISRRSRPTSRGRRSTQQPGEPRGVARGQARLGQTVEETRRALIAQDRREHRRASLASWSAPTDARHLPARHAHRRARRARRAVTRRSRRTSRCTSPRINPQYISADDVPAEQVAREREIFVAQAASDPKAQGKPPEIVAKMVEGRVRKYLGEITLLGQPFVQGRQASVERPAQAGQGERDRDSCATRSAPASRRSRKTSRPRSWRRCEAPEAVRCLAIAYRRTPRERGSL